MNRSVFAYFVCALFLLESPLWAKETDSCRHFYSIPISQQVRSSDTETGAQTFQRRRSEFRNFLVDKFLHLEVTTQHDREEFIRNRSLSSHANRVVFEFENSKLKELNDQIKDKDLITAIDNYASYYILKHVENWMNHHFPGTQIKKYSDGKSLTLIIDGPNRFLTIHREQIDLMFETFQENLSTLIKGKNIFRESDKIEEWFRMGVGNTTDEAYFAARRSRKIEGVNRVVHFSAKEIKEHLGKSLKSAKENPIFTSESLRSLMEYDSSSKTFLPGLKVFEVLRKATSVESLIESLEIYFGRTISTGDAKNLLEYADIINQLNPKFFVVDQSVVTLSNALEGGIVVDRKGMGSANQHATALAVARSNSPASFFRQNRLEEESVTQEINRYRKEMEKQFGAKCRGDDCIIESLDGIDKKAFLNHPLVHGQRIVFIPPGIPIAHHRSEMSTHGESIEKLFIKTLYKNLGREAADAFTFAIDFKTLELGQGSVELVINPLTSIPTPEYALELIRNSFHLAVENFNLEQKNQNKETFYLAAELNTR